MCKQEIVLLTSAATTRSIERRVAFHGATLPPLAKIHQRRHIPQQPRLVRLRLDDHTVDDVAA